MAKENQDTQLPLKETAAPQQDTQQTAEAPANNEPKRDRRKKDPTEPTLVPFNLITPENRQRLYAIGKADNATLTILLDAYEKRATHDPAPAQHNADDAATILNLQEEIKKLKQEISSKDQEITAKKQEIQNLNQQLAEAKQKQVDIVEAEEISDEEYQKLKKDLKEFKDRALKAEQRNKEDQELINNLNIAKRELTKGLEQTRADLNQARDSYLNVQRASVESITNYYPEGDILHFFPTITAKMLELTATRLTAKRTDGKEVTAAMILGDMFNRYTIDQYNNWFYSWVLSDKDILEIAKSVEPKIESIRMLRAALGIR